MWIPEGVFFIFIMVYAAAMCKILIIMKKKIHWTMAVWLKFYINAFKMEVNTENWTLTWKEHIVMPKKGSAIYLNEFCLAQTHTRTQKKGSKHFSVTKLWSKGFYLNFIIIWRRWKPFFPLSPPHSLSSSSSSTFTHNIIPWRKMDFHYIMRKH